MHPFYYRHHFGFGRRLIWFGLGALGASWWHHHHTQGHLCGRREEFIKEREEREPPRNAPPAYPVSYPSTPIPASPPHPPANAGNNFPGANPYPSPKDQKAFEKGLLEKTAKSTNDVILYDNRIVVYKTESDVMLYVVGPADENEIMLYSVVLALRDSLNILLK